MPFIGSIDYSLGYTTLTQRSPAINTSNLIIWLEASNYTSGATWSNLVAGQPTYTLVNTPIISNATYNGQNTVGMSFNGTNQYAQTTTSLLAAAASNNWAETKELWYYNRSGNGTLFSENGQPAINTGWIDYIAGLSGTNLIYSFWQGNPPQTAYTANTGMQPNTWYHIIWQHNKTNNQFLAYVNGSLTMSNIATRVTPDSVSVQYYITIAANSITNPGVSAYFNGLIGSFRWYNTILTPQQILSNFQAQRTQYGV